MGQNLGAVGGQGRKSHAAAAWYGGPSVYGSASTLHSLKATSSPAHSMRHGPPPLLVAAFAHLHCPKRAHHILCIWSKPKP
jgi:hypothetical protein